MTTKVELQEKFIGFVDILGYSALTRSAEQGCGFSFEQLEELTRMLGADEDRKHFEKYGPTTCPMAPRVQKHMDFQVSQAWDSVVVSAEVSPAGLINLVSHCFGACIRLLTKGVMCRGYIKRGRIHHEGMRIFGSGHVDAVAMEKQVSFYKQDAQERGTPFIEVDPEIVEYVNSQPDKCVKEMFSRMVLTHEGLSAVFPIRRLSHSFVIGGFGMPPFDPTKEKKSNDNLRQSLLAFKKKVSELVEGADDTALRKSQHYLRALDQQLQVCNETDEMIDRLQQPFGRRYTKKDFPGLFREE
jgi:hypothetical protein